MFEFRALPSAEQVAKHLRALIVDEAPHFNAVLHFCATRGIRVPHDISLIWTDADSAFAWCKPTISHIRWDSRPVMWRFLR